MLKRKKKRSMTLLEIMVAIFIIGVIGSVIGYNMKGSMKKGKQFKTDFAATKIAEVLTMETELNGLNPHAVAKDFENVLKESGMVKDVDKLIVDGYGEKFKVAYVKDAFKVTSSHVTKDKKTSADTD